MQLKFIPLPTQNVRQLQQGGPDANGQTAEIQISKGSGECRHCLQLIPEGEEILVLAYRPFPALQPFAELGPIFLCAKTCEQHHESSDLPPMFAGWDKVLLRGYGKDDRIVYGSGIVVETAEIIPTAAKLFESETVAYAHIRSATNNCYECRVERADATITH